MALSSSSTYADAHAQYRDNLNYDVEESLAKSKLFVEACRWLIDPAVTPKRTTGIDDGAELEIDTTVLKDQLNTALEWYQDNKDDGFGSVVHPDFEGLRT